MSIKERLTQMKKQMSQDAKNAKNFVAGVALVTGLSGVPTGVSAQSTQDNTNNETKTEVVATKVPYDFQSSFNEVRRHLHPQMSERTPDGKVMTGFNSKGEEISFSHMDNNLDLSPYYKPTSAKVLKEGDMYYIFSNGCTFSYDKKYERVGINTQEQINGTSTTLKGKTYLHRNKNGYLRSSSTIIAFDKDYKHEKEIINWDLIIDRAIRQHDATVKEARENGNLQAIPNAKNKTLMYQAAQQSR